MYAVYLKECLEKFNLTESYGISVFTGYHHILANRHLSPPSTEITNVIENADIVIHEPSKKFDEFNTHPDTEKNIYKNFNLKSNVNVISVPHLDCMLLMKELKYWRSDLESTEQRIEARNKNFNNLLEYIDKETIYHELSTYLKDTFLKERHFATFCHPMPNLITKLMKGLMPKIGVNIEDKNIEDTFKFINCSIMLGLEETIEEDYQSGMSREIHNNY
jgi:hypothetical protein